MFKDIDQVLTVEEIEIFNQMKSAVEAVAHVGVDFGYGEYFLEDHTIQKSREILEKIN